MIAKDMPIYNATGQATCKHMDAFIHKVSNLGELVKESSLVGLL